jgi:hypothetical protein
LLQLPCPPRRYLVQRDQIEELMSLYKTHQGQDELKEAKPDAVIVKAETGDDGEMDFFAQQQQKSDQKKKKKKKKGGS